MIGPPLQHYDSLSFVTAPADNGTFSVAFAASSPIAGCGEPPTPTSGPASCARTAPRPLGRCRSRSPASRRCPPSPIAGPAWSSVGRPVATGVVAIGDAVDAARARSSGRGMTLGAMQAVCLRDVLREVCASDPVDLAHRWHDRIANVVMPLVDETLLAARHRLAQMDAQAAGTTYDTDDQRWTFFERLFAAAPHDPEVLRAAMDVAGLFRRLDDVARREDIVVRINAVGDLPLAPGPTRHELESLIDGSPASIAVDVAPAVSRRSQGDEGVVQHGRHELDLSCERFAAVLGDEPDASQPVAVRRDRIPIRIDRADQWSPVEVRG